jgi:glycosyltransferase involved in cell wall biosynthesis
VSDLPRLLYVFRDGWAEREREVAARMAPAESYGYFALRVAGHDVDAVDSSLPTSAALRALSLLAQRAYFIPRSGLGYRLDQARAVRRYVADDPQRTILATNDSIALPLLALRSRGLLANPVAAFSIGLCDALAAGRIAPKLARKHVRLLHHAHHVFVFTPAEREHLASVAPDVRTTVLPLGIDSDWWAEGADSATRTIDVLAPGRDPARSFPTLADAVRDERFRTVAVGTLARAQGVLPDGCFDVRDDVSFSELRALLHSASVVAIPARQAVHGAGQTTALQAMAAGRPVVMTDSGWASHHGLRPDLEFMAVPPADPEALRAVLRQLLADEQLRQRIGVAGRRAVITRFSSATQLKVLAEGLTAQVGSR